MRRWVILVAVVLVAVVLVAVLAMGCAFTKVVIKEKVEEGDRIISLTEEEIEGFNEKFKPLILDRQDNVTVNIYSYFFTSFYDRPEDINIAQFLRHFQLGEEVTDEIEFEMLKADKGMPFNKDMTLADAQDRHVPIHKFPSDTINQVLQKYTGITLGDLSGEGVDNLVYLEDYDAYYNFTSDFAAGTFYCTHGERQGDIIRLYNERDDVRVTLTLKEYKDDLLFISHQRIEKEAEQIIEGDGIEGTENEISKEDMLKYIEEEIYIPGDAKKYLNKRELVGPNLLISDELRKIYDEYKETYNDGLLVDLQPIDLLRLYNKATEEENYETKINLLIIPEEISRDDFLREIENDQITRENESELLEKYKQFNGKVIEIIVNDGKAYVVIQGDGFWRFERNESRVWKLGWLSRQ